MKYIPANSGEVVIGENYKKEVLLKNIDLISSTALSQLIFISPKTTVKDHYHKKTTEVFYFLNGTVNFVIGGKEILCNPGDLLVCDKDEMHEVRNESDKEVKYLAVKTQVSDDTFWK